MKLHELLGVDDPMKLFCKLLGVDDSKSAYQVAQEIVRDYRMCAWCKEIFKVEDTRHTVQYAQEKDWCIPCYELIKNDW